MLHRSKPCRYRARSQPQIAQALFRRHSERLRAKCLGGDRGEEQRVTFERLSVCAGLGSPALTAREASVLEFPVLRELHGPISGIFPASLTVRADSGAGVRMPALDQSPSGRVIFVAEGSNSVISLHGIRRMDGAASGTPGSLEAQNGGLNFASGQRYEVLRFASRSGDFSTGTGLGQGAINLQRIYSSTVLELVAP